MLLLRCARARAFGAGVADQHQFHEPELLVGTAKQRHELSYGVEHVVDSLVGHWSSTVLAMRYGSRSSRTSRMRPSFQHAHGKRTTTRNIFPVRLVVTLHDEFTRSIASIHVRINET